MTQKFSRHVGVSSNALKSPRNLLATLLAILLQRFSTVGTNMDEYQRSGMSLHRVERGRKYLNLDERRRFRIAAGAAPDDIRLFCLTLMWSGSRISETLALTPAAIDLDDGVAIFETLKRRRRGVIRQVPLPQDLLRDLDSIFGIRKAQCDPSKSARRLWRWSRATAWRHVKVLMKAAGIPGGAAMPKGLRHTFGVIAFQSAPPHMVQRWLGHASPRTTAIYGDVCGPDERMFAARMWEE